MTERFCADGCGYEVSDSSDTARRRSFPSSCPHCGGNLLAPTTGVPDDDISPEVQEFAQEHGLDAEEVAERRGDI